MYVNEAIARQSGRTGVEYKINELGGEYILLNARYIVVTTNILGPDS